MRTGTIDSPTYEQLAALASPRDASQPETYPDVLYDTQVFVDNTSTTLTFFGSAQSDQTLSNIGVGQLPAGEYFRPVRIFIDYVPAAFVSLAGDGTGIGVINDMGMIHVVNRGVLTLNVGRDYGPWPLTYFRGSGSIDGHAWGTFTAEDSAQFGHNALGDGPLLGAGLVLKPNTKFRIKLDWAAVSNTTGDVKIRVGIFGFRSRPVA